MYFLKFGSHTIWANFLWDLDIALSLYCKKYILLNIQEDIWKIRAFKFGRSDWFQSLWWPLGLKKYVYFSHSFLTILGPLDIMWHLPNPAFFHSEMKFDQFLAGSPIRPGTCPLCVCPVPKLLLFYCFPRKSFSIVRDLNRVLQHRSFQCLHHRGCTCAIVLKDMKILPFP